MEVRRVPYPSRMCVAFADYALLKLTCPASRSNQNIVRIAVRAFKPLHVILYILSSSSDIWALLSSKQRKSNCLVHFDFRRRDLVVFFSWTAKYEFMHSITMELTTLVLFGIMDTRWRHFWLDFVNACSFLGSLSTLEKDACCVVENLILCVWFTPKTTDTFLCICLKDEDRWSDSSILMRLCGRNPTARREKGLIFDFVGRSKTWMRRWNTISATKRA